ncbi:S9 family peptidase [Leucobacter viscericola]|uniref:S9 family peptidase n=1 Tax=Leucobacter viscericola TaxID=2714935 RepID=A0A6G7XG59_9MICO|nr:prolyl oligopeptidase family serine peptidase [Leucobacter viscericola]QIK63456.1 S9 family peptidase [Leucobacter viscericola]
MNNKTLPIDLRRSAWVADTQASFVDEFLEDNNRRVDEIMALSREEREGINPLFLDPTAPIAAPLSRIGEWFYTLAQLPNRENVTYLRKCAAEGTDVLPTSPSDLAAFTEVFDVASEVSAARAAGVGNVDVNLSGTHLLYQLGYDNADRQDLFIREVATGASKLLARGIVPGALIGDEEETAFYLTSDNGGRPDRLWHSRCLDGEWLHREILHEPDLTRRLAITRTRSRRFIVIHSFDKESGQVFIFDTLQSEEGDPRPIRTARKGVRVTLEHSFWANSDQLIFLESSQQIDRITASELNCPEISQELWRGAAGSIDAIDAFASSLVLTHHTKTSRVISAAAIDAMGPQPFAPIAKGPLLSVLGLVQNSDWHARQILYGLESPTEPGELHHFDTSTGTCQVIHSPSLESQRSLSVRHQTLQAIANDGVPIPITLLTPSDHKGPTPLVLRVYGAYGATARSRYSPSTQWLLDNGISVGIAHVRGGGEQGPSWHQAATREHKIRSATDYVACAHKLIAAKHTEQGWIAGEADSAGGLTLGAALNNAPEIFGCVLLRSPFLDPVGTMSDPLAPLTTTEWAEWGNPSTEPHILRAMKLYSPLENIRDDVTYPPCFVTTSKNDSRVAFHESARWAARLQFAGNSVLLRTFGYGSGHLGPIAPAARLNHSVFEYQWIRDQLREAQSLTNRSNHG